ncbi:hypothetical protein C8R45DRAFT_1111800 [Mycena sanguinolenta]|nr:hypothetical protein C8R45DRAFT_1111800 [Mycena sanguinolenta]
MIQAASAVRNWRSKFRKIGIRAVSATLEALPTVDKCVEHVENELLDSSFVYEDQEAETGAYRSELILRIFAAHLQVILKTDVWYGHPVGTMALSCAAAERALHMHKTGTCSADGIKRKGKRSAHNFVAVPWAARTKAYLPGIQKLSTKKWTKIIEMSRPFIDSAAQVIVDDTDVDELGTDSRGLIQVSDDSDAEEYFLISPCRNQADAVRFEGLSCCHPNIITLLAPQFFRVLP